MRITESKLRSIIRSVIREWSDPVTGEPVSHEDYDAYNAQFGSKPAEDDEESAERKAAYQKYLDSLEDEEEPEYDLGGMPIRR